MKTKIRPRSWRRADTLAGGDPEDHRSPSISQWRDQEWQHLIDQLPDQHRTIRLHPAIEADLQRALATETEQPTTEPNPPATEESSNPAPAETASTLDVNAESFLHDFNPDGVLESDEDDDAQLARDAIDLEASLKDAEASPVVTLVDRILLTSTWSQLRPHQDPGGSRHRRTTPGPGRHRRNTAMIDFCQHAAQSLR